MSRKSYWMIVTAAILCLAMAMVGCSPEEAGVLKIGNVDRLPGVRQTTALTFSEASVAVDRLTLRELVI